MRLALAVPMGLILAGTILVSGCDGSNNNQGQVVPPAPAPAPGPSSDDAFVTIVRQQTDTPTAMSETSDPIEVARIVETSPETTEPQAVKF
ncbi:MAG: hypothetical protein H7Z73_11525 [Candidatus Saccharibacteria bacterium]|nr:hypothetical protein [Moraxellaceae bacterium]